MGKDSDQIQPTLTLTQIPLLFIPSPHTLTYSQHNVQYRYAGQIEPHVSSLRLTATTNKTKRYITWTNKTQTEEETKKNLKPAIPDQHPHPQDPATATIPRLHRRRRWLHSMHLPL